MKRGCLGCLGLIGIIIVIGMISSALNGGGGSGGNHDTAAVRHTNGGWDHKAVTSERQAGKLIGGWPDNLTRKQYHQGLLHIRNEHQKIGSFTIGQVVDQERSREQDRATFAKQQREAAKARAQTVEEARYQRGTPDCLVMDKSSLHTESGEYTWYINGRITNKCDRDLRYVQVSFSFFNSAGNLENSGLVNVNNLAAGNTWAFHKAVYESNTSSGTFRVEKIEGF
ncbi:MAG: hypothetical protein JWM87_3984 [Candidatus Eremiobacteraeota bacterium]|nr:hypothetical protein [Candidatus Eremiobacteraeota bacterium]